MSSILSLNYLKLPGNCQVILVNARAIYPRYSRRSHSSASKTKDYVSVRHDESFCRTVLDLTIMDRLRHLEDKDPHRRLRASAEVPVSIRIQDIYGNSKMVKDRADQALGYGTDKSDTGAILLVVEAKPYESAPVGMPQLLIYMAAVHEARQNRINNSVFGMISDSKEFRFCSLNQQNRLFTSRTYIWTIEQSIIIAYSI